jgi:hypothetical protein
MKKECLICFLILAFLSDILQAQNLISGSLQDEKGLPLSYANVLLLYPADSSLLKGMVTNEKGFFLFDQVERGSYLLKASMVGYEDVYKPSLEIGSGEEPLRLETIVMKTSSEELEEVTVLADKNLFEMKVDRMVVNVQSSITASSGTVLEVLERSPGVKVDHYNSTVSMNSKNGVQVMINGKLNRMPMEALYQMLGSMQAVSVDKIELITTPPANMDAEGNAGFINIVLLQNEGDGVNGSFFVNAEKRRRFNSALGGDINIRKNRFSFFASHSFTYQRDMAYVDIDRVMALPDYLFELSSRASRNGGADIHNFRMGIDYNLNSKTIVGILTTVFDRNWSQVTDFNADFRVNPGTDSLMNGNRKDKNLVDQTMFNFNLQHNFTEKQQLNLDLDYFYYKGDQPQDYTFNYFTDGAFTGQDEFRINKKTPMDIGVAKLDYSIRPNDQLNIETGAKITYSGFFNEVLLENKRGESWIMDPVFSENSGMDEGIAAAYSSFSFKIKETDDLKVGLRYEYTDTRLTSENADPIHRKYGSLFPTLFYSKKLNEQSIWQFSFNRRITRPNFSELAPFVLFSDPVTFVTGNSFLRPSFTESVKTDFQHKGIIFSLQANRTKDAIYIFQPQSDPINNVTTYSSLNIDLEHGYIFNITLPMTLSPWWEVQNNLQAMLQKMETKLKEAPFKSSQRSFSINSSHTFKLPKNFSMELSGFYSSPTLAGIRTVKAYGAVNVGARKEFSNNWGRLNLSFSDIFRTNKWLWEIHLPEQHLSEFFVGDFDAKGIKLTYTKNFGNQKVERARKRETGSAEEQKRL